MTVATDLKSSFTPKRRTQLNNPWASLRDNELHSLVDQSLAELEETNFNPGSVNEPSVQLGVHGGLGFQRYSDLRMAR
jgi:hypothetical protein